ncbi:MAG: proline--tRNA ligase [Candidatus Aenigmarchaeota archaeon]|nr:proline--tRNA ligase [Candidatus Aenigmarchaeota archaeon]
MDESQGQKTRENRRELGITASREKDFSEWYSQVILKSELADYTAVSGCIVFRPYSYTIWEIIQKHLDSRLKKAGVKNAYFPLFIPESLLAKEKQHVQGFNPEVAWVTHAGETKLGERLAIRPTSETIMYDSYAKWIRSYNDLPLRINQWNNSVRWEFKHPVPFLRTREFLWQEGHSVFATQNEAEKEVLQMLGLYAEVYEKLLAVPVVKGRKTGREKFAGAEYSTSIETFLPIGKAIQCATSHFLGQNFSRTFEITYLDKSGKSLHPWQNSWGISTRSIGIAIIMHGDNKGLVLPPKVAPIQIVVVPIVFEKNKDLVIKKAGEIAKKLSKFRVHLDDRDNYTPGWKFNEWELKGVPLRIEIGPKDMEKKQVVVVRRDTGEKMSVPFESVGKKIASLLDDIQENLYRRAKDRMEKSTVEAKSWQEFLKNADSRRWVKALHCGDPKCEEEIQEKTQGVKANCIPFDQPKKTRDRCVHCNKPAKYEVLFAKSY